MRSDRFTLLRGVAVLLAAALLFALLAAACDGDGGATPEADEMPAAAETPAEEEETPPAEGDEDGLQELEALAGEAAEGVTAKVTYRVSTETDGEVMEGEWVLVQRPPDSRFEIATTEGGQEFRTIIISAGGKSYVCTAAAGQESCLATEAQAAEAEAQLFDPLFEVPSEIAEDVADVDLMDRSERQIAGVDATCFRFSSSLLDLGESEMCFSDEGLLLLLQGEGFTFEATSVSTDVTDADFEPPYEITELPEFDIPPTTP